MVERPLAERLFLEADLARHQELIDYALGLIRDHENNAPRIDTGEWTAGADELIEDLRSFLNETEDHPLRGVRIDVDDRGDWCAVLESYPRPFPWEKE